MITLTSSQLEAVDVFKSFMGGPTQVLMLKGAAGTGKTTLVAEFLKILDSMSCPYALMAPTGRAAYIIGSKTNRLATTIHRGIYELSGLVSDSNAEEALFAKYTLRKNESSQRMVYIIDESSMISDAFSENEAFSFGSGCLLSDLMSFAENRKIVFVGDYAQLPPVGMNFSPAMDEDYIAEKFGCKVSVVMLKEVLRQSGKSTIYANAKKIRDSIEAKTFIEFKLEEGEDCIAENVDLLKPYFDSSEAKPNVRSAIITYSNRQVLLYNTVVRRHYYGEDVDRLRVGDLLMIARNNYAYDTELFNGNIVQVESCSSQVDTHCVTVKIKGGKTEKVKLQFRNVTIKFASNNGVTSLNVILLDNFLDDPSGSIGGILSRALIIDFEKRLPPEIANNMPEIRSALRSKKKLTEWQLRVYNNYLNRLREDRYYNALICKYGYAMTCHKAQGGEWENAFVDMCRYGGCSNEDYFRWAYTAITRAGKRLWIYRSPDFDYISKLVVDDIAKSSDLKISTYSGDSDFRNSRFARIAELSEKYGITVTEDRSRDYQHRISFANNEETSIFVLWYKLTGYSNKDVVQKCGSGDFQELCQKIIDDSYFLGKVPFVCPERPFAEKLVDYIKSILEELDIVLLDIKQGQYQDVFHLKTDGFAIVALFYTGKGNYTHMSLVSSLGSDDSKLEALRRKFL